MDTEVKPKKSQKTEELISFIFYCLTFIGCGAVITGLGPLIPFFAESEGHEATEYSFLFFCRAAGYCVGSILCKVWQRYFKFHHICIVGSLLMGGMLIAFSWIPGMMAKAILLFLASIMNATIDIFINMSIIQAKKNDHLDKWLQINHGAFGIGGLMGPLLVFWFSEWSFAVMAIIFLAAAPAYLFLTSPETYESVQSYDEQLLEAEQKPYKQITPSMSIVLCLMFLLLIGEESAFGGWISSYAVIQGIQNKEDATFYGSLFWIVITMFRFIFLLLPGKPSSKSIWMYLGCVLVAITSVVFLRTMPQYGNQWLIYSSTGFGIFMSIVFPLLLSTPKEYGINLKPSDNSNFMIAASLGQGTIAVFTGYSMDWFGPDMIFYSILAVNVVIIVSHFVLMRQMQNQPDVDPLLKQTCSYEYEIVEQIYQPEQDNRISISINGDPANKLSNRTDSTTQAIINEEGPSTPKKEQAPNEESSSSPPQPYVSPKHPKIHRLFQGQNKGNKASPYRNMANQAGSPTKQQGLLSPSSPTKQQGSQSPISPSRQQGLLSPSSPSRRRRHPDELSSPARMTRFASTCTGNLSPG